MAKTETFTKLTAAESTAEVAAALTVAGITGCSVSSSGMELGRQRKYYLATVASRLPETSKGAALAALRNLPDVCSAVESGRNTVCIYRRLS
jgi:hypothetical protein